MYEKAAGSSDTPVCTLSLVSECRSVETRLLLTSLHCVCVRVRVCVRAGMCMCACVGTHVHLLLLCTPIQVQRVRACHRVSGDVVPPTESWARIAAHNTAQLQELHLMGARTGSEGVWGREVQRETQATVQGHR